MAAILVTLGAVRGGLDGGARSEGGLVEKDLALAVVQRVQELLRRTERVEARLLRQADYYLPEARRGELAARLGSACHVEVRFGSADGGTKVRVLWGEKQPGDADAARAMAGDIAKALSAEAAEGAPDAGPLTLAAAGIPHVMQVECPIGAMPEDGSALAAARERLAAAIAGGILRLLEQGELPAPTGAADETKNLTRQDAPETPALKAPVPCPVNPQPADSRKPPEPASAPESPAPAVASEPLINTAPRPETAEVTVRPGLFFVWERPDFTSRVIAVVRGGEQAVRGPDLNGFSLVLLRGKSGYIVSDAWEESAAK